MKYLKFTTREFCKSDTLARRLRLRESRIRKTCCLLFCISDKRERAFIHLGKEKLEQIVEKLADVANVDEQLSRNKSQMHIVLTPN